MAGAFLFALGLWAFLVLGTYLIQGVILLLQATIWAAVWAVRIAYLLVASLVWSVWWLFDRREATAALERAEAAQAR
ncbi:MAG TPA: hypothetical protein VF699_00885 [Caulobacteraceae bacterium]